LSEEPHRRPGLRAQATYGPPARDCEIPGGHHRELIIFRLAGDRAPVPLEAAGRVITVWRNAILAMADQPVCEAITGHAPESSPEAPKPSGRAHLALLPLADVGHRYTRSHLLGLAAALPAGLSPQERRACLQAVGRVDSLTLGRAGLWTLERCDAGETRRGLLAETWRRPSRVWATVTPVVFGRYPGDLWGEEAAAMVKDACGIAGLPRPMEVATAPVAWVLGVPSAARFPALPSRLGKPRRAHAHVRLVFSEPIGGPVLAGAGLHHGYGLFQQLTEGAE
jgi:CRISPR-associated protein Csb2